MKTGFIGIAFLFILPSVISCGPPQPPASTGSWKARFNEVLPLLGHRNWIVVADKAFPQQPSAGIEYINTNEPLLQVLEYVTGEIKRSGHVKPVFYRDRELNYIPGAESTGIQQLREQSAKLLSGAPVHTMLHDSVFARLAGASEQFKVVVLKTNELIPYSSVLLELDCAYWNGEKEAALRERMAGHP
jgi:hypothetical protein